MEQEIHFCVTPDKVRIAYGVAGDGPLLVKAANWLSHLEFDWSSPIWRPWLQELSRHHRLVRYDERGCGLSDWDVDEFSVEAWVRDLETVVDALSLERFALLGLSQGGPVAIAYAVRHPERVSHLILYGTYARGSARRGYSQEAMEEYQALLTLTRSGWGRDIPVYRQLFTGTFAPDATELQMRSFNELQRVSTSPQNAVRFLEAFNQIDVTALLPQVQASTLVLHAREDQRCPFDEGRRVAADIPGSRFVALESRNHILLEQEPAFATFIREVRKFLGVEEEDLDPTAETEVAQPVRELVTVLFTDIVSSTEKAVELGDREWTRLLGKHHAAVRSGLRQFGGTEINTSGDGFLAVFDGPARAIRCAESIVSDVRDLGIEIRAGIHTGECERTDDSLSGIAVHVGARVMAAAAASEVLVSSTVAQLVAGSDIRFSERGSHELRGVPGTWQLYRVESS